MHIGRLINVIAKDERRRRRLSESRKVKKLFGVGFVLEGDKLAIITY